MVALDLAWVTAHTPSMNILVILGAVAILLAILGLAGVIATTLIVEIVLAAIGLLLIAFSTGRLNL